MFRDKQSMFKCLELFNNDVGFFLYQCIFVICKFIIINWTVNVFEHVYN